MTALVQQTIASVAGGVMLAFMASIWRFAKNVKENSDEVKQLSTTIKEHITNHPT